MGDSKRKEQSESMGKKNREKEKKEGWTSLSVGWGKRGKPAAPL